MSIAGINLQSLTLDDLRDLAASAQKELEKRERDNKLDTIRQMKELARKAGISTQEFAVLFSSDKPKVAVKFRNPEDPSQTWSGRGKRPRWLQEALEQGKTLEQFRIA